MKQILNLSLNDGIGRYWKLLFWLFIFKKNNTSKTTIWWSEWMLFIMQFVSIPHYVFACEWHKYSHNYSVEKNEHSSLGCRPRLCFTKPGERLQNHKGIKGTIEDSLDRRQPVSTCLRGRHNIQNIFCCSLKGR